MNSLALFMVDLQMAQGRLRGVFDVVDEMCTARTPNSKLANAGKRDWRAAKPLWTFVDQRL